MTNVINTIQGKLAEKLTDLLGGDLVRKVYGYRILPLKLTTAVSVTYMGGKPEFGVFGSSSQDGDDGYFNYALSVVVKHNNTESELESAEQVLNEIESRIFDSIVGSEESGFWHNVTVERPSARPPSPTTAVNYRYGEIYLRVHI